MKYKLPPPKIDRDTGFASDIDIFNRINFGKTLVRIFDRAEDGLVVGITADWGEGKSTFIQMWMGHVIKFHGQDINVIYFDAFENDFQKDAFLAITGELYASFPQNTRKRFLEIATSVGKGLARGGLKLGARALSTGLASGDDVDKVTKEAANLFNSEVENLIDDRIKSALEDKKTVRKFKSELAKLVQTKGSDATKNHKTVFVIDELDRCRPDFSLEILEIIKHFFDVPGLSFLLVVNRNQLEHVIRGRYGVNVDATQYLNKFVQLFLSLPKKREGRQEGDSIKFFNHCLANMSHGHTHTELSVLRNAAGQLDLPLRDIERLIATYNVACNACLFELHEPINYYSLLAIFVVWISVREPHLLTEVVKMRSNGRYLVNETELKNFKSENRHIQHGHDYIENMLTLVMYDKGTDSEREKLVEEKAYHLNVYTNMNPKSLSFKNALIGIAQRISIFS